MFLLCVLSRERLTKGVVSYVMDNFNSAADSVAAGAGEQLHDGRVHSHSAGGRHRRGARQDYSGPPTLIETRQAKRSAR